MPQIALTILDAVRLSGIGQSSLYESIAAGRLPARKLGRRTVIMTDDPRAWLDGLPPLKPSQLEAV